MFLLGNTVCCVIRPESLLFTVILSISERVRKMKMINRLGIYCSKWQAVSVAVATLVMTGAALAGPKGAAGDLYVANFRNSTITQVDSATGQVVGDFAISQMNSPEEGQFGPNGNLFVVNQQNHNVTEYDGTTGTFIRVFASDGLGLASGLRFKANGNLLVYWFNIFGNGSINEYDPSGNLIGTFASGLHGGAIPINFGPDGNLYVSNTSANSVDRFTPDGTPLGTFASGGGLVGPEAHTFGPNGNLFVVGQKSNNVIEYDGSTGALIGTFIDSTHLNSPSGIAFGPDGNLWVANVGVFGNDGTDINEFDGSTGAFIQQVTGFAAPLGITVKPGGGPTDCLTMTVSTLTAGQNASWDVSGATPGSLIAVVFGFQPGSTIINGQLGFCATFGIKGVSQNKIVGTAVADGSGNTSIVKKIPANTNGITVLTQAAEQNTCPNECVSNLDTQVVQ